MFVPTNRLLLNGVMVLISLLIVSCGRSNPKTEPRVLINNLAITSTPIRQLGKIDKKKILIEHDVDLKGGICILPKDITLCARGGMLRNGMIIGNGTKIQGKNVIFDKVTIKGNWIVPEISTKLFADLSYENSLRDVVALANPEVKNHIVIEKGDYKVRAKKNKDVCVQICSNTDLILNGTIQLIPNDFEKYDIMRAKGENIIVKGTGTIIGDKHSHIGTEGQWGMGIRLSRVTNMTVKGLTIKDCWGDCIYVGGNSRNVLIENCHLDHGRRQGISVTKASGVTIRKCMITNVGGSLPEYAIDIEPNKRDSVNNILIENVTVKDCEGGFAVYRGIRKDEAKTPWIGQVTIKNCEVSCKTKVPIKIRRCEGIIIEKCSLHVQKSRTAIDIREVGKAVIQNNTLNIDGGVFAKTKTIAKKIMGRSHEPISVKLTRGAFVKNNYIFER